MWVVPAGILDVEQPVERKSNEIDGVSSADSRKLAEWVAAFWEVFAFAKNDGAHFTSLEPANSA